ncbi:MAG: hypothetical protein KDB53_12965 [Planctomycetes bacterium]|nr:hypothetical protein [Planctomycetota bacterium]
MPQQFVRQAGFSMIEFLITIAFLVVLLSVAVPSFGNLRDGERASQILELTEELGRACERHRKDTGRPAIEFSPARGGHSYSQPRFHELSMPQPLPGWKGPYLASPLSLDQNPYGAAIYLQNRLGASPANGFDLHGSGKSEQTGAGQFVVFYGIPERVAREIDQRLDGSLEDLDGSWRLNGRVEWIPSSGGALSIFISSEAFESGSR